MLGFYFVQELGRERYKSSSQSHRAGYCTTRKAVVSFTARGAASLFPRVSHQVDCVTNQTAVGGEYMMIRLLDWLGLWAARLDR